MLAPVRTHRQFPRWFRAAAGCAGLSAWLACVAPAATAGTGTPVRVRFGPGHVATVGADAVSPYVRIPGEIPAHVAGTAVQLTAPYSGRSGPRCRAYGAGYWLGDALEDTVGDPGPSVHALRPAAPSALPPSGPAAPSAPGMTAVPRGLYRNPTVSYRANPDPGPTRTWEGTTIPATRDPGISGRVSPEQGYEVPLPARGAAPTWVAA